MDVIQAIKTRRSVRTYADISVEEEKLTAIFEATRLAPSASNRQEWRFVVVRDAETRHKLAVAAQLQPVVLNAPVIITACAETDEHLMLCGQLCYPIDVAIALDHLTFAALELGLGTCWIGKFDEKLVKEALGIPDQIRVVELMTLGYPDKPIEPAMKNRLPLDKIVRMEHW
jgi:nitroreductase